MNRRRYLACLCAGVTAPIAGCAESSDNGSGGGNGDDDGGSDGQSAEDYVDFLDHEFELPAMADGVDMIHTYQNVSDQELDRIHFECELFVDNERVGEGSNYVRGLGAGIEETDSMYLSGATRLDDVTHYTISITVRIDREDIEETYEFTDFEYR